VFSAVAGLRVIQAVHPNKEEKCVHRQGTSKFKMEETMIDIEETNDERSRGSSWPQVIEVSVTCMANILLLPLLLFLLCLSSLRKIARLVLASDLFNSACPARLLVCAVCRPEWVWCGGCSGCSGCACLCLTNFPKSSSGPHFNDLLGLDQTATHTVP
jgi:hypothetical protein